MDYNDFKEKFRKLSSAKTVTDKFYTNIRVDGDDISYTRESGNNESLSSMELYNAYNSESHLTTTKLIGYISGRQCSPSLALLIAAGFYDSNKTRLLHPADSSETLLTVKRQTMVPVIKTYVK